MSMSLYWRPAPAPRTPTNALPTGLKSILSKTFNLEPREPRLFDVGYLPYLRGLSDAGVEGAQELIEAIDKHQRVELLIDE